jgi:ssDNA-binding Zn-finger/Zn-ribbon topoisomerase 1
MRDKPVPQSCPECGARFLVEKTNKDGTRVLQCVAEGCKYKEALPDVEVGESDDKSSLVHA